MAPTLRRYAGRCPPRGLALLGAARRWDVAPTLHRCAGRCPPPGGRTLLGAARRGGRVPWRYTGLTELAGKTPPLYAVDHDFFIEHRRGPHPQVFFAEHAVERHRFQA